MSLFGAAEVTIPGQPGVAFGGSQPMAVYCDLEVESTDNDWVVAQQEQGVAISRLGMWKRALTPAEIGVSS